MRNVPKSSQIMYRFLKINTCLKILKESNDSMMKSKKLSKNSLKDSKNTKKLGELRLIID